jgi:general secretion pathway protein D
MQPPAPLPAPVPPPATPAAAPAQEQQPATPPPEAAPPANQPPAPAPVPQPAPLLPVPPTPPAPPPPAPKPEDRWGNESVGLIRIPDLGTNEILEMLENLTGKAIMRKQNLPAVKITFYSQGPMTRREAILAIESLLSINGVAITEVGEKFLKAVPAPNSNNEVPIMITGSTLDLTPSEQIYTKFFYLDYLTTQETVALKIGRASCRERV